MSYLKYFLFLITVNVAAQSPERVILNLTADPATSMAITWRMDGASDGVVQYAVATPWTEFTKNLSIARATKEYVEIRPGRSAAHYSAVLHGLKPDTRYAYRVGHDSLWTEWNQFSTAAAAAKPFSFVWFGDPQNDIEQHCSRVFRQAFQTCGAAGFWLFSGDITSDPEDTLMGELFTATGFILRTTPSVLVPGNHELGYRVEGGTYVRNEKGRKVRTKDVSPLWHGYYTLPENGIRGMEESSYTFEYQGVRFIMLNSNDRLEEQAAWIEQVLSGNTARWTIAAFHHPLYSSGDERDDKATRTAFQRVFDRNRVDLVLTGHDHIYSRSKKIRDGVAVPDSAQGTVYIVSTSGPKQYELNPRYRELMVKMGSDVQLYQSVSIEGGTLRYRSCTANGEEYDAFELKK